MNGPAIIWFRRDLRLEDNPALAAALAGQAHVLPVFIYDPDAEAPWAVGAAARWWLHHALADLNKWLGGRLRFYRGESIAVLKQLVAETGASDVYWNRLYEPALVERDTRMKTALCDLGVAAHSHNAALLYEPWALEKKAGGPFRVFTPFWKTLNSRGMPEPQGVSGSLGALWSKADPGRPVSLDSLGLLPISRWDLKIAAHWTPTRAAAEGQLEEFLVTGLARYAVGRDHPADADISRLSPYLHFGQLGPREVAAAARSQGALPADYLRQLAWRDFAHHLLFHFPQTGTEPLDPRFRGFPWREAPTELAAWQRGETGIPLVDAGMRELWETGWMHNRVRMVVASFLTKNLLLPWQAGAGWFWDTLVDADLANNTMGWQWTAGCGADAAPYFRVFNPVRQGERFDSAGHYVRRWVPELARLPDRWVHRPWEAGADVLDAGGVHLGADYPEPIVDLADSRRRALAAWERVK